MLSVREAQCGGGLRHVELELICRGHLQRWPSFRQARTPQPGRWSAPANPDRAASWKATLSVLLGNFIRPHASSWVPPAPAPVPPWRSTMCADSPAAPALRAPACKPLAAGAHCCCRSSKWTTRRHMHVQQCGQEGQRL